MTRFSEYFDTRAQLFIKSTNHEVLGNMLGLRFEVRSLERNRNEWTEMEMIRFLSKRGERS